MRNLTFSGSVSKITCDFRHTLSPLHSPKGKWGGWANTNKKARVGDACKRVPRGLWGGVANAPDRIKEKGGWARSPTPDLEIGGDPPAYLIVLLRDTARLPYRWKC